MRSCPFHVFYFFVYKYVPMSFGHHTTPQLHDLHFYYKQILLFTNLKFIYSKKATKFCEISTLDLSYVVTVKSTLEISQTFVAFSE